MLEVNQAQVGQRGSAQPGPLRGLIGGLGRSLLQISGQAVHQIFRFAHHHVVRMLAKLRNAAGNGTADHGSQSTRAAAVQNPQHFLFMNEHAAEHRHVRPLQIPVCERADIDIHQALFPVRRKQGSHRQQAQRRVGGSLALKGQRVFEAPVCVGPFRIDQQGIHNWTTIVWTAYI